MATLEITALVEKWEAVAGVHAMRREIIERGETPDWTLRADGSLQYATYHDDFNALSRAILNGVRIASVRKNQDPDDILHAGDIEVRIAPESLQQVLDAVGHYPGIEIHEDGLIRVAVVDRPDTGTLSHNQIVMALGLPEGTEVWRVPGIVVQLERDDWYVTEIADPDTSEGAVFCKPTGTSAKVNIAYMYDTPSSEIEEPGKRIGSLTDVFSKRDDTKTMVGVGGAWAFFLNLPVYKGFTIGSATYDRYNSNAPAILTKSFLTAGGDTSSPVRKAAGVPSDAVIARLANYKSLDVSKKIKGRALDISDQIAPDYNRIADWPKIDGFWAKAARLNRTVRSGYRSNSISYSTAQTSYVAVLGITKDHKGFCKSAHDTPDAYRSRPKLPVGDKATDTLWINPSDRVVFQRSPLGWHGLIMLDVTIRADGLYDATTDRVYAAYCIPVFMAFTESRDNQHRYRRLPPEIVSAIVNSYGLSDFLQHVLMTLAGAKVKLARKGLCLETLGALAERAARVLPEGHMIRSWGTPTTLHPYEMYSGRTKHEARTRYRACELAHDILVEPFKGLGAMQYVSPHEYDLNGNYPGVNPEAYLQPVATRRVLEL